MAVAVAVGLAHSNHPPLLVSVSGEVRPEPDGARPKRAATGGEETSALDGTRLGARALNAIRLLWGPEAKRQNLVEADAYPRLCRTRGVGKGCLAEIERAVVAWGFEGLGGKRTWSDSGRRQLTHRKRLDAILRDIGPKDLLELLADLCEERAASCRQKVSTRSSRLRRARCLRAVVYYARSSEYFRQCVAEAPLLPPR